MTIRGNQWGRDGVAMTAAFGVPAAASISLGSSLGGLTLGGLLLIGP